VIMIAKSVQKGHPLSLLCVRDCVM
jgi:4-aminobutyrate aminotransferase-like enzyme